MRTRCIPELGGLPEELGSVIIIDENHILNALLMTQRKFMQRMGKLCSGMLCAPLEPLDTFPGIFGKPELAIEFCQAETIHGTRMLRGASLAEELHCFGAVSPAAPAVLATCACTVASIDVPVFRGNDEEGEGTIKVLFTPNRADSIGETVCQGVLRKNVAAICDALQ